MSRRARRRVRLRFAGAVFVSIGTVLSLTTWLSLVADSSRVVWTAGLLAAGAAITAGVFCFVREMDER